MDINEKLEQTNTFYKGMNTDTSDSLLDSGEYRIAYNLRPVTNTEENDNELHLIDGVKLFNDLFEKIYKTASIRNIGIVIGEKKNQDENTDDWGIYKYDLETGRFEEEPVFGPCKEKLGEKLSVVTRWESDSNIKLYIADGIHEIMCVNVAKDENENGDTIEDLIIRRQSALPALTVEKLAGEGILDQCVLQYAYVLYNYNGGSTKISPLSKAISTYHEESSRVKLNVSFESNITRIKVYRIKYVQSGQEPEIYLIYDDVYEGLLEYVDSGRNISQISYAEFVAFTNIEFKPVLIESKDDYLFAGNIQYEQLEVDDLFKNVEVTYTPYDKETGHGFNNYGVYNEDREYKKTLKRGETYRYGIVFYDKLGRRSSVMHIKDVPVPEGIFFEEINNKNILNETFVYERHKEEIYSYLNNPMYYQAIPMGIEAILTFDKIGKDNCFGYEIVRCERTFSDSIVIASGIIGRSMAVHEDESAVSISSYRTSTSYMSLYESGVYKNKNFSSAKDLFMFASPDLVYDTQKYDDILKKFKNNIFLKPKATYYVRSLKTEKEIYDSHIPNGYVLCIGEDVGNANLNLHKYGTQFLAYFVNAYYAAPRLDDGDDAGDEYSILDNGNRINMTYLCPRSNDRSSMDAYKNAEIKIKDFAFTDAPSPGSFDVNENVDILKDSTVVGDLLYINWEVNSLFNDGVFDDTGFESSVNNCVTSGKKCALLYLTEDIPHPILYHDFTYGIGSLLICHINTADIINGSYFPYGGDTESAKKNSIFYSLGNYFKCTEDDTQKHILYDGDCYIGLFIYNSGHCYNSANYHTTMNPTVYAVPMETRIDLKAVYGDLYPYLTSPKKYYFQDVPVSMYGYAQEHSAYLYNTVHSLIPNAVMYTGVDYSLPQTEKFDTRILYSKPKTNGESIDSWLQFQSANFIDVDSRFGELTNLRLFKNTLLFWLEFATGMLSVNERTIIQSANDTNIILGNSDVLQRYDYITTLYGMHKGLMSDIQSNTTLYWWDWNNKEILAYSGGQQAVQLNKYKHISNYLNKYNKIDEPALAYDQKYKEVLFNVVEDTNRDGSLVYNEDIQQFTGVYEILFQHAVGYAKKQYFANNNIIYKSVDKAELASGTNGTPLKPYVKYVVNKNPSYNKVYDIATFGGRFYGGDNVEELNFRFTTPLKQEGRADGSNITNREYDFRLNIPRAGKDENGNWSVALYGDRLRGKTMQCEIWSDNNSTDFSLQYITTKYRMSWG